MNNESQPAFFLLLLSLQQRSSAILIQSFSMFLLQILLIFNFLLYLCGKTKNHNEENRKSCRVCAH